MSDDVVVVTNDDLQDARKVFDGLETTIECLGAARLTQVSIRCAEGVCGIHAVAR